MKQKKTQIYTNTTKKLNKKVGSGRNAHRIVIFCRLNDNM